MNIRSTEYLSLIQLRFWYISVCSTQLHVVRFLVRVRAITVHVVRLLVRVRTIVFSATLGQFRRDLFSVLTGRVAKKHFSPVVTP
jgi:hypothetical protein